MLRGVDWLFTDVSEQPVGPIFKVQAPRPLKMGIGCPGTLANVSPFTSLQKKQ